MIPHTIDYQSDGAAERLPDTSELIDALAPIAADYAANIALAKRLPPSVARRCQQRARGRYYRLLRHALRAAEWLTAEDIAR